MAIERSARAVWKGDLKHGSGAFDLESSGAVEHEEVTFASRFEQPGGKTSPEELIAAAHATCFSMALANGLAQDGHTPTSLETEAVATSVALARRLGLDTETVLDALGGSPLVSPWQAAKLQRVANGEFSPQFALSLALKDVHLALQAAGDGGSAVLACLADEWQQAVDHGLGGQDLTVVTRAIEQQGGTP